MKPKSLILIILTIISVAPVATAQQRRTTVQPVAPASVNVATAPLKFDAVEPQTRAFINAYKTIRLTPAQGKIKSDALSSLKAVCCKDFSALTCCCPCNFSKSLWGMAHFLIAKKGYNVAQVQDAAKAWIAYVNPKGFSGDSCQTGSCGRTFAKNGCGGMDDTAIAF